MYCALPSSLQSMIDLPQTAGSGDEFMFRALSEFLKALSVLGVSPSRLTGLRKHLRLLTCVKEEANEGAASLEALLRQHDLLIGPDMGGFANLLKSAIDEELVFNGESIDFEGLDSLTKQKLGPLHDVAMELLALDDIAPAISSPTERVAACVLFDGMAKKFRTRLEDWVAARPFLESAWRLYTYQAHLENLSVDFVQYELREDDMREFALWLLARILSGKKVPSLLERRLIDTLFKKAGLASLAVFESAG